MYMTLNFINIRHSKAFILLICLTVLSSTSVFAAKECKPQAETTQLNRDFFSYLQFKNLLKDNAIGILPFYDNEAGHPDPNMAVGLPFFIYDTFIESNSNFIHPYITLKKFKESNISNEKLTDKSTFSQIAQKIRAKYLIGGSIQKMNDSGMRVYVSVYSKDKKDFIVKNLEIASSYDDKILNQTVQYIHQAFEKQKIKLSLNSNFYTPDLNSFKLYIKGLLLAQTYDENSLNLAKEWLEKSTQDSLYKYQDAALALARTYFMQSLLQKLTKQSYHTNFSQGQNVLLKGKIAISQETHFKKLFTLRYVFAQNYLAQGILSLKSGNKNDAFNNAYNGLKLAPEDGILQELYSRTYTKERAKSGIFINNPVCF